jgi:hypothetical protein
VSPWAVRADILLRLINEVVDWSTNPGKFQLKVGTEMRLDVFRRAVVTVRVPGGAKLAAEIHLKDEILVSECHISFRYIWI